MLELLELISFEGVSTFSLGAIYIDYSCLLYATLAANFKPS